MEESGTIFGRAFDDEGGPDRGAHVTAKTEARPQQPAAGAETFTDLHGEYELRDVRPGTWTIGSGRKGTKQSVEVAAGARVRVDLAAELSAAVSGRVLLEGEPVAGSVVTARRTRTPEELSQQKFPAGWKQTTRTSAAGEFALKLRPGEWTLQAGGGEPALGLSEPVSFVLGPRDQRRVDLVFGGAAVSGRVTDAQSGEPIAGVIVGLAAPDPPGKPNDPWIGGSFAVNDPDAWPRTDAEGRFVIPHVPPGEYSLTAAHPEFESQRLPSIALGGSDANAELSIALERRTGIRATVERVSGAALGPGYALSVLRAEGGKAKGWPIEAGQSKFMRLSPGDWTVRLLDPGKAEVASQSITLAEGEQRSLTFVVQP